MGKRPSLQIGLANTETVAETQAPVATPPKAGRGGEARVTVYLHDSTYQELRRLAFEERGEISDYCEEAIVEWFAKRGREVPRRDKPKRSR